jgi:4-hydroxy-tetrahydrodipicolinate synthase
MSFKTETRGLWVATLTPQTADGAVDTARLTAHARALFAAGVDGVAPFGTTGEGQSFSTAERKATLEALLRAGIPADKIIVGIGCAALPDAIDLARHALAQGVVRVLQLPPFFFKGIDASGVAAAFARTIDGVGDDRLRLFLYHIPQVSAAPVHHAAIASLVASHPQVVAGIKDSAAEWPHTQALLRQFPQLAIFVGCEAHAPQAMAAGGVGTICGMGNLVPHLMRRLVDTAGKPGNDALIRQIEALVKPIGSRPFIAASKAVLANATNDPAWRAVRAPLMTLSASDEKALLAEFAAIGVPIYRAAA